MGRMPTRDQILEALKVVIDPELRRDIVELEMVRAIEIRDGGAVDVTVSLTTPGCPIKNHFETAVADAVRSLGGVTAVSARGDAFLASTPYAPAIAARTPSASSANAL